jgi:hypothetical protein
MKRQKTEGAFDEWQRRERVFKQISYVLDHMTGKDQQKHLGEFDAKDLIGYLRTHIREVGEDDLNRLANMPLKFHRFPILNQLLSVPFQNRLAKIESAEDMDDRGKLVRTVHATFDEKLKEISLSRLDKQMAKNGGGL